MAYTDPTLNNTIKIKKAHIQELETSIKNMITNKKVSGVTVDTMDYSKVENSNIVNLQKAINALETKFSNNCCESDHCQTCQSDRCERCQEACTQCSGRCERCQETCAQCSNRCERCQETCAQCSSKCQSCQSTYCQSQCSCYSCGYGDCGCGGD